MQNLITVIAPQILVAGAYSFVGEIRSVVFELRWMLAFIVVMIVADFVLGIIDSVVKRGEDFRFPVLADVPCASSLSIIHTLLLGSCWALQFFSRLASVPIQSVLSAGWGWLSFSNLTVLWSIYAQFMVSRTRFPLSACWWATLKKVHNGWRNYRKVTKDEEDR